MSSTVRPTDRHLAMASLLDVDLLVALALDSLHALNRRAKTYRDNTNRYRRACFADAVRSDVDGIYALKTSLLDPLVRTGRATVETLERLRYLASSWYCEKCDRERRSDDNTCFRCYGVGTSFGGGTVSETWAVATAGGHRWHQPPSEVTEAMRAVATPGQPNDPTHPAREIPRLGLTIEAQHRVIELAIERLAATSQPSVSVPL